MLENGYERRPVGCQKYRSRSAQVAVIIRKLHITLDGMTKAYNGLNRLCHRTGPYFRSFAPPTNVNLANMVTLYIVEP